MHLHQETVETNIQIWFLKIYNNKLESLQVKQNIVRITLPDKRTENKK
jgi:hypothetical protein